MLQIDDFSTERLAIDLIFSGAGLQVDGHTARLILHCGKDRLKTLRDSGQIQFVKVGGSSGYRYDMKSLVEFRNQKLKAKYHDPV